MDKSLNLHTAFPAQSLHFRQRQLSGGNYSRYAELFQEYGPSHIGNCHLGTGMKRQTGKTVPQQGQRPYILHNNAIQPRLIEGRHKFRQLFYLFLLKKRIYGKIQLPSIKMCLLQRFHYFLITEIPCKSSCPEPLPSYVNGVSSRL